MSQKRRLGVPGSGAHASAIVNAAFASRVLGNHGLVDESMPMLPITGILLIQLVHDRVDACGIVIVKTFILLVACAACIERESSEELAEILP